ncbi:MAG: photosynthetic complex assembly protein PuhC [Erythrobacter sp.]|uniref:photosynthetic complex assembly protein PuhC n=1 Tax=Erythrobacter sp. TaxID=1042 RepID=UPI00262ACA57|nr:photosynthetic complex assembly protein PuhC [Erythrobacter sp.]MDJ0979619.1 photosynthetic complex assembly protein PuhC [Erythrobacter sp.]
MTIVRTYDDDDFRVHTLPLIAMGTVIAITLALAISTSLGFFERQAVPESIRAERGVLSVDTRSITFNDAADGSVWVADAETGLELGRFPQGEGGFVRATARAMVHNRIQHGIGPAVPFELIAWDTGAMTLRDTQTGRAVELSAFGSKTHEIYRDMMAKGRE